VARSWGGAYSKGIYYGRWSVRHTNFTATLRQEGAYNPGGLIAKGGAYMPDYTVLSFIKSNSTDPRDKIFALLEFIDQESRASPFLQPNYSARLYI